MNEGLKTTEVYVGLKTFAVIAVENAKERSKERALEEKLGVSFPRCPVCGGRRRNMILGRACVYCGSVEGGVKR